LPTATTFSPGHEQPGRRSPSDHRQETRCPGGEHGTDRVEPFPFFCDLRGGDEAKADPHHRAQQGVYLTLMFGEGDDVQYCLRRIQQIWNDPKRGEAPANWTIDPLLADVGPASPSYYRRTATPQRSADRRAFGFRLHPQRSWPADEVEAYLIPSGRCPEATGMHLVYAYNLGRDNPEYPEPHAGARHHPVLATCWPGAAASR
jgi:GxGYxYP putative glycoside hydrolase C-terminal domain